MVRVEFELPGTKLHYFGIDTPEQLRDGIPGLWCHLTRRWLTYHERATGRNPSRSPIGPVWRVVQAAFDVLTPFRRL